MAKAYSLTEVKASLPRMVKGVEEREEEIVITRNGKPAAIILNYDEFIRLKETIDVLSDKNSMRQIKKSREYFKKNSGLSFEEVFGEPL